jgi:hypothetical protein
VAIVPSPPATPPPHSLIRAADTTHDADPDWEKGLTYLPEAPGGYQAAAFCSVEQADHRRGLPTVVDAEAVELRFYDPCETTFGYREAEVTDRLRRLSEATESYGIARELWTGELAKAAGLPNPYLAKAPTVINGGTPVSPKRGLGLLEEAIGDALMGQQAFLHCARAARPYLWELVQQGNLLFTKIGNSIVCDAGYNGSAPDGEAEDATDNVAWIYATGPVVVRRTPLTFYAAADAEVIDTATNQRVRTASKLFSATFDPAALFAVPVTLD